MNRRAMFALLLGACTRETEFLPPPRDIHVPTTLSPHDGAPPRASDGESVTPAELGASRRPNLQWKRSTVLEADLSRALELAPEELCIEFGTSPCLRQVHTVALGGHDPFESGMLEPASDPLVTTPTVVDRVTLSACGKAAERDLADAASAKVFTALAADPAALAETADVLYRRLLARDPTDDERALLGELARNADGEDVPALEFAKTACFVVASSAEFLFF
jgi:hypothetical protein